MPWNPPSNGEHAPSFPEHHRSPRHTPPPPSFGAGHRPPPHEATNDGIRHVSLQIEDLARAINARFEWLETRLPPPAGSDENN